MVYVRIEMWPNGDRTRARLLQEVSIANVGGTAERGNYTAVVSHSTTFKGNGFADPARPGEDETWRDGKVAGFDRKRAPVCLVVDAILDALGLRAVPRNTR